MTFDDRGVSGHGNHISVYRAALEFAATSRLPVFSLVSYSTLSKYTSWIFFPARSFSAGHLSSSLVVSNPRPRLVWSLMAAHASQFVWFRKLFVAFSSYTYFNEYIMHRPAQADKEL